MPDYSSWFKEIAKGGADNPIEPLGFAQGMQMMGQAQGQMMRNRLMKMQLDEYEKNKNQKPIPQDEFMRQITDQYFPQDQQQMTSQQQPGQDQIPPMIARPPEQQGMTPQQPGQEQIPPMIARPPEQQEQKNEEPSGPSLWDRIKSRMPQMAAMVGPQTQTPQMGNGGSQADQNSQNIVARQAREAQRAEAPIQVVAGREGEKVPDMKPAGETNAAVIRNNNMKLLNNLAFELPKATTPTSLKQIEQKLKQPEVQNLYKKVFGAVPDTYKSEIVPYQNPYTGIVESRVHTAFQADIDTPEKAKMYGLPADTRGRYEISREGNTFSPPKKVELISDKEASNKNVLMKIAMGDDPPRSQAAARLLSAMNDESKGDHYTIQNDKTKEIKSMRLKSGESIPKGWSIKSTTASDSLALTPEALKALGERFNISGEIPGLGMGKAATNARTQILNKWAKDMNNAGLTPGEQLAKQASYKAAVGELRTLQNQRGKVMAFAKTADLNLKLAAKLIDKVPDTQIPIINRALRRGDAKILGSPEVAEFYAAARTGINEYAKVTSSATGGGVTSDNARNEIYDILDDAYAKNQWKGVVKNVLQPELENRKIGYDDQIKQIGDSIASSGMSGAPKLEMKSMPDPRENNGKIIKDTSTGKRYQSDGKNWTVIK